MDILAFITGAASCALFFMLGAFFGAAYNKAVAKFETSNGVITFNLNKLIELEAEAKDVVV